MQGPQCLRRDHAAPHLIGLFSTLFPGTEGARRNTSCREAHTNNDHNNERRQRSTCKCVVVSQRFISSDESDTAGKAAPGGAAASSQVGLVVGCWLLQFAVGRFSIPFYKPLPGLESATSLPPPFPPPPHPPDFMFKKRACSPGVSPKL